jgi:DNA-binding MarR family transcriptional regulator
MAPAAKSGPADEPTLAPEVPAGQRRVATEAESKVLASTLRMRILRVCLHEPHSNKEIAQVLGKDPATTLHHVRRLIDTGFLAAQPVRRGTRGSREIPYLATRKSWRISVPSGTRTMLATFLEEAAQVPLDELDTARLGLLLSAGERDELMDDLLAVLERYRLRTTPPAGRPSEDAQAWSLFLAVHPDPNRPPSSSGRTAPGSS